MINEIHVYNAQTNYIVNFWDYVLAWNKQGHLGGKIGRDEGKRDKELIVVIYWGPVFFRVFEVQQSWVKNHMQFKWTPIHYEWYLKDIESSNIVDIRGKSIEVGWAGAGRDKGNSGNFSATASLIPLICHFIYMNEKHPQQKYNMLFFCAQSRKNFTIQILFYTGTAGDKYQLPLSPDRAIPLPRSPFLLLPRILMFPQLPSHPAGRPL